MQRCWLHFGDRRYFYIIKKTLTIFELWFSRRFSEIFKELSACLFLEWIFVRSLGLQWSIQVSKICLLLVFFFGYSGKFVHAHEVSDLQVLRKNKNCSFPLNSNLYSEKRYPILCYFLLLPSNSPLLFWERKPFTAFSKYLTKAITSYIFHFFQM